MQMTGYTKLFGSIITSTIWREKNEIRILWITMLAMKNKAGLVEGSIPGLADMARLSIDDTQKALDILSSPDPYSRTKEFEGRRIAEVDGGWLVLNHEKWRSKMNADERREYLKIKQREHRAKVNKSVNKRKQLSTASTHADADADADKKESTPEAIYSAYPRKIGRPKALMAIRGAMRVCKADDLLQKTKAYALAVAGSDMQFIPYPSTWFNQQRFNDDPREWARGSANGKQENTFAKKQNRINRLNDRKAELMRLPADESGNLVDRNAGRELQRINMELETL